MEKVKKSELYTFISQEKLSISEFIKNWKECLHQELSWLNCKDMLKQNALDLNIPKNVIKSLEKDMNLGNSICKPLKEDKDFLENLGNLVSNVELETLNDVKLHNERINNDLNYRMNCHSKYRHEVIDKPVNINVSTEISSNEPIALLTVQIFEPAIKQSIRCKLSLDREFQVLSSHPLSVLRDSYICISDVLCDRDYSENPLKSLPKFTGHEKFGFFLINNTFYTDTRNEDICLNSLLTWAKDKNIGSFGTLSMMETKFEDLEIQLGFPYLYLHKGNCEHLVVFTDIRIFIPQMEDSVSNYPKYTAVKSMSKVKCQMCTMYFSKWVTMDNKRLPTSPFYFCHNCFISFNYDSELRKIGSFKAYPIMLNLDR